MIGRTLLHYEVLEPIGAGGMGEVYKARDTRLNRDVALKLLPSEVAQDPERVGRFEREAKALASLQHPNIAGIFGFERAEEHRFLVMELVDGEDLAERLKRGPIAVDETLRIAAELAEGIEAAHEKGIIHRDLKPANVRLNSQGQVKILDFGLARALTGDAQEAEGDAIYDSPTLTAQFTQPGVVLGTAAYMSPEQARGKQVDRRADIWAYGCIVYEMLTGKAPFAGDNVTDLIAEIVKTEPEWDALPEGVPARVKVLLWRCLQKDPRRRLRDIGEARFELSDGGSGASSDSLGILGPTVAEPKTPWAMVGIAAIVALSIGVALGTFVLGKEDSTSASPSSPPVAFTIQPDEDNPLIPSLFYDLSISPDGRTIIYQSTAEGQATFTGGSIRNVVRELGNTSLRKLSTETGGLTPAFSPDSKEIAFVEFLAGRLVRMAVSGGPVTAIGDSLQSYAGADWSTDGHLYIAVGHRLVRIAAGGGRTELIAKLDDSLIDNFQAPIHLPKEDVIVTGVRRGLAEKGNEIVAIERTSGEWHRLTEGDVPLAVTGDDLLIYRRDRTVFVQRLDPSRLQLIGSPLVGLDDVSEDIALSETGTIAYTQTEIGDRRRGQFIWIDHDGNISPALDGEWLLYPRYPRISPDGKRVAFTTGAAGAGQIWVHELSGTRSPVNLTFDGHNTLAVWSPDQEQIAFKHSVSVSNSSELRILPSDGSSVEPTVLSSALGLERDPGVWVSENILSYQTSQTQTVGGGDDIFYMDLESGESHPVVQTRFIEEYHDISEDGKWIAYHSDRSGITEIWAQRFPTGPPQRVSSGGGVDPVWSRDGTELYYQSGTALMAVAMDGSGEKLQIGKTTELFRDSFVTAESFTPRTYDVHPDGRFLMLRWEENIRESPPIFVIQNWLDDVRQRLAAAR